PGIGFEALLTPVLEPLFFGFVISAPGREPHARRSTVFLSSILQGSKAMRESGPKTPQRARIIPTIVEQERVQFYIALFDQLFAERTNYIESGCLVVWIVKANVVPGVVGKEWRVRARPLALDVAEEAAPHLPRWADANHGKVRHRLACAQREFAMHRTRYCLIVHLAD